MENPFLAFLASEAATGASYVANTALPALDVAPTRSDKAAKKKKKKVKSASDAGSRKTASTEGSPSWSTKTTARPHRSDAHERDLHGEAVDDVIGQLLGPGAGDPSASVSSSPSASVPLMPRPRYPARVLGRAESVYSLVLVREGTGETVEAAAGTAMDELPPQVMAVYTPQGEEDEWDLVGWKAKFDPRKQKLFYFQLNDPTMKVWTLPSYAAGSPQDPPQRHRPTSDGDDNDDNVEVEDLPDHPHPHRSPLDDAGTPVSISSSSSRSRSAVGERRQARADRDVCSSDESTVRGAAHSGLAESEEPAADADAAVDPDTWHSLAAERPAPSAPVVMATSNVRSHSGLGADDDGNGDGDESDNGYIDLSAYSRGAAKHDEDRTCTVPAEEVLPSEQRPLHPVSGGDEDEDEDLFAPLERESGGGPSSLPPRPYCVAAPDGGIAGTPERVVTTPPAMDNGAEAASPPPRPAGGWSSPHAKNADGTSGGGAFEDGGEEHDLLHSELAPTEPRGSGALLRDSHSGDRRQTSPPHCRDGAPWLRQSDLGKADDADEFAGRRGAASHAPSPPLSALSHHELSVGPRVGARMAPDAPSQSPPPSAPAAAAPRGLTALGEPYLSLLLSKEIANRSALAEDEETERHETLLIAQDMLDDLLFGRDVYASDQIRSGWRDGGAADHEVEPPQLPPSIPRFSAPSQSFRPPPELQRGATHRSAPPEDDGETPLERLLQQELGGSSSSSNNCVGEGSRVNEGGGVAPLGESNTKKSRWGADQLPDYHQQMSVPPLPVNRLLEDQRLQVEIEMGMAQRDRERLEAALRRHEPRLTAATAPRADVLPSSGADTSAPLVEPSFPTTSPSPITQPNTEHRLREPLHGGMMGPTPDTVSTARSSASSVAFSHPLLREGNNPADFVTPLDARRRPFGALVSGGTMCCVAEPATKLNQGDALPLYYQALGEKQQASAHCTVAVLELIRDMYRTLPSVEAWNVVRTHRRDPSSAGSLLVVRQHDSPPCDGPPLPVRRVSPLPHSMASGADHGANGTGTRAGSNSSPSNDYAPVDRRPQAGDSRREQRVLMSPNRESMTTSQATTPRQLQPRALTEHSRGDPSDDATSLVTHFNARLTQIRKLLTSLDGGGTTTPEPASSQHNPQTPKYRNASPLQTPPPPPLPPLLHRHLTPPHHDFSPTSAAHHRVPRHRNSLVRPLSPPAHPPYTGLPFSRNTITPALPPSLFHPYAGHGVPAAANSPVLTPPPVETAARWPASIHNNPATPRTPFATPPPQESHQSPVPAFQSAAPLHRHRSGSHGEVPRATLQWDRKRSGNILVSNTGTMCLADASRALQLLSETVLSKPTSRAPRSASRSERLPCGDATDSDDGRLARDAIARTALPPVNIPMYAIGTIGIADGEFIFEVRVDIHPAAADRIVDGGNARAPPTTSPRSPSSVSAADARPPRMLFAVGVTSKYYRGPQKRCPAYLYRSDGSIVASSDESHGVPYGEPIPSGSHVTVHLNLKRRQLSFSVDGRPQGVAFRFRPVDDPEPLFPIVVLAGEGDTATLVPPTAPFIPKHVGLR